MDGYHVIDPQEHGNGVDPETHKVTPGYHVKAEDHETGTVVHVFVPDQKYSARNVQAAIEDKLGHVREVARLGSPPAG